MDAEKKYDGAIQAEHVDDLVVTDKVKAAAKTATQVAHELSLQDAIKAYPMAIFWCLMVSMCYDTILIGNFYAYPEFAKKYGQFVDDKGRHQLSASWQAGLGNASQIGCFLGVAATGALVSRFGQKRVILAALLLLSSLIFVTFFASSISMLLAGQLLCGLPWGVFVACAPAYASEVLPLRLRVYLTSWTNMCFIVGQLIAAGVLAGLVGRPDEWGYRIPFALQWAWPALLVPVLCFAPESPWHLVRVGRSEEARKVLARLQRKSTVSERLSPETTLAEIVHTNDTEARLSAGTGYLDCFRGTELRRTEIACVVFAGQVLSGSSFAYNSTYFFQQVGLDTSQTYYLNTGGTAMALVGTLVSWFAIMPFLGRRTTYLAGMAAMCATLLTIGLLQVWGSSHQGVGYAQAVLTLVWTFVFQLSVGQLGFAIPAEIGSTRLRQRTICLARNSYYVVAIVSQVLQPYFMNPGELDLRGYTGFVWGATALAVLVWAWFRLPESRGRTYEELDILFARRTPTRKFASTRLDDGEGEPGTA
ncbi:maltose permease MAL31 [Cordyceps fumosorosea ARSEF 2679]|uniref:Maltose permease MAL31 n=1 Tax=Cordyceps fumosorosea (strain ARSEF 2679) TaxID=1081104 RepID=A0A162MTV8_CORFA|nr:maltose permease MAL31 [Cordyceps fumosorosea ARSEF 2679]OAA70279.1 maltose permease MAL31 [Cordyceps fumosorosea ARSEF 2679]